MEPENELDQYINVLLESYKPVASLDEATHFFSTDEVFEAIKDINPGSSINKETIFQTMLDNGFIFKPRAGSSGISFKWLLAIKY